MSTRKPLIDKDASRRIRVQTRRVLLEVWNPIGARMRQALRTNTTAIPGDLYDLLISGAPDSALVEYLYLVAHDRMGLGAARRSDMDMTAEVLRETPLRSAR